MSSENNSKKGKIAGEKTENKKQKKKDIHLHYKFEEKYCSKDFKD